MVGFRGGWWGKMGSRGAPGPCLTVAGGATVTTFYGSYEHSIDDRGRVAIPAKYRASFAVGVVLRLGPEGCVELYTPERFEEEKDLLLGESGGLRTQEGRRQRRQFLAGVSDQELDKQGRIVLSPTLRAQAGLSEKATIVGCGDYIEIWDPARWERELASVERETRIDGGPGAATGDGS